MATLAQTIELLQAGIDDKVRDKVSATLQHLASTVDVPDFNIHERLQQSAIVAIFLLEKLAIEGAHSNDRHAREVAYKCLDSILNRAGYPEIKKVSLSSHNQQVLTNQEIDAIKQRAHTAMQEASDDAKSTIEPTLPNPTADLPAYEIAYIRKTHECDLVLEGYDTDTIAYIKWGIRSGVSSDAFLDADNNIVMNENGELVVLTNQED